MSDTIVLIHGLWMTPLSWEHWSERFSDRGHRVLAPAWPGMEDRTVESLRWEAVADHALEWSVAQATKLAVPH
jgi:pimeloyl-ACP methyl ester carboxylesterase